MRKAPVYPLAAGLALALAMGAPAGAQPADPASPEALEQQRRDAREQERLDSLEREVLILQRKLEVQEEEAAKKATKTPIVGAGPDGFFLRSPDSKFLIKLRGYAQFDSRWLVQSEDAGDDTFLFRRVRPFVEGTLFEHIDFRIMPDFAGSTLTLFDAYVNLRYLTQFQVQGGKFKPPLGLERLQSATALMTRLQLSY